MARPLLDTFHHPRAAKTGHATAQVEVMVTAQKASLQFTGMAEVRNKLLNAYQEVMNMQV